VKVGDSGRADLEWCDCPADGPPCAGRAGHGDRPGQHRRGAKTLVRTVASAANVASGRAPCATGSAYATPYRRCWAPLRAPCRSPPAIRANAVSELIHSAWRRGGSRPTRRASGRRLTRRATTGHDEDSPGDAIAALPCVHPDAGSARPIPPTAPEVTAMDPKGEQTASSTRPTSSRLPSACGRASPTLR
jgi:hypothetical protein